MREVESILGKGYLPLRRILQDARLQAARPLISERIFDTIRVERTKTAVESVPLCKNTKFDYEPGTFQSDLVVGNDNAFPLTEGVVLRSRLPPRRQDVGVLGIAMAVEAADPSATEVLWFDRIDPQQRLRFKGVDLHPAGRDVLHAVAFSQENRSLLAVPPIIGEYKGICTWQKDDHSDIYKTTRIDLVVTKAEAGATLARMTLNPDNVSYASPKREVNFSLSELCDGIAYATSDGGDVIRLYQHDRGFYGWLQSAEGRANRTFTAFVLGRTSPD